MNNSLKRRRPFGHEDSILESVFPAQPLSQSHQYQSHSHQQQQHQLRNHQLDSGFSSLPYDFQLLFEQAASLYGLSGIRLHQLARQDQAFQDQTHKKQKLSPDYTMSSAYHHHDAVHQNQEKLPLCGPHDTVPNHASDGGLNNSFTEYQSNNGSYAITQGLASLKLLICPGCMTRLEHPEVQYQPLSSRPCEYGTAQPYAAEKPPSAHLPGSEAYLSGSLGPNQALPFNRELSMIPGISPHYPSMTESRAAASQAAGEGSVYLPTTSPAMGLGDTQGQGPNMAVTNSMQASTYEHGQLQLHQPCATAYDPGMFGFDGHENCTEAYSHQYAMPNALPVASAKHDLDKDAPALDVVFSHQKAPAAKRGPFKDQAKREQTAQTRRIGSCIRCRMQRIRCEGDEEKLEGSCLTCVVKQNGKVWRLPCLRVKFADVKLFKPGQVHGYEWTQRWKDNVVDNIANWASHDEKKILISEGFTPTPVELRVRRFVPQEGDKLDRSWVHDGIKRSVPIPPFAIVDLDEAQEAYTAHIKTAAGEHFMDVVNAVLGQERNLLWQTYYVMWQLSRHPSTDLDERILIQKALEMWVAVRLTTASSAIVGEETLGMDRDIMDETSPQHGKIPLPPVMGAQIDLIVISHIQTKMRRELLDLLQRMTQANKQKTWLTTYLVTFALLHNIALITEHDARYARKHGMKRRWARESEVKEYHYGAVILLSYFHYCNKGIFPFTEECRDQDLRSLAELDGVALEFVYQTRRWAIANKKRWAELQRKESYEDDYYWVSQIYEYRWQPQLET